MSDHPVIIAGAGPTGLSCALFLVRSGIPVLVLEAEHGLPQDMRASTFHPATLDLLNQAGVAEQLLGRGSQVPRWQYLKHGTGESVVFDLGLISDLTEFPYRLQCEQFRLTNVLVDVMRDEPLFELKRGCRVSGVEADGDGVWVEYAERGELRRERAGWVIAADGGHSAIRKSMGLSFEGSIFPKTSLTLVMDHPFQDARSDLLGVNYVWTQDGHYSLMQVRDLWRLTFSPREGETVEEALGDRSAEARVQALFPRDRPYTFLQRNHYTLHQRCLERFRQGRVLFAGDSAHLNSPAGGMGMNSGIHDAACLVEHLLPVLDGADHELLDRYDRRRRTMALEEVQRLSARNYHRHRETDPAKREEIWADLAATAADPERARAFLMDSSMINSRIREREID